MIKEKIESFMNIRPGEWGEAFFFWIFNFLIWFSLGIGDSLGDTLFIKRVGYENLPQMFILCSILAIPLTLFFTLAQGKFEKRRLTNFIGFISAVFLFVAIKIVNDKGVYASEFGYHLIYFVKNSLFLVLVANFSIIISTQFNSLKGKRLVPLIFTGSIGGQIASGVSLNFLALRLQVDEILWVWLAVHCGAFFWFVIGSERFVKRPIRGILSMEESRRGPGFFEQTARLGRLIFSSRLVFLLILSSFFLTFTAYFSDFTTAGIFSKHFVSENNLARFYGVFNIFSSFFAFIIQGTLTGFLIHRFGVGISNLIFPLIALLGFGGVMASCTLIPGVILRFISEGLGLAIFTPVNNLFYNALPKQDKSQIIAVNEGVFLPLASVAAGLMILATKESMFFTRIIPIVVALTWFIVCFLLKKPYRDGLMRLLKSSNLDLFSRKAFEKLPLDANTMNLLLDLLASADDETSGLIVQLILNNANREKKEKLFKILRGFSDSRKSEILKRIRFSSEKMIGDFLLDCLESNDEKLQLLSLKGLAAFPSSERLRRKVPEFLNCESLRLRALAAVILARIGDLDQMVLSMQIINDLIYSQVEKEKLLGIEVLGFTYDERFWVNLRPFLSSADSKVRLAAARSLELLMKSGEAGEHYDLMSQLIKDDYREIRHLALKMMARLSGKKWFFLVVEGLSDSSPRNRKLSEEILISKYDDMIAELIMVLENNDSSLHAKASVAKILSATQDSGIREYLHQFGNRVIRKLYEYKIEEYVLKKDLGPEKSEYFSMILTERAWAMTKLIICLVAPEQNREARDLFKSLYSSNEEMISNAIEVLQNMGERQLVYHIIPILENISLKQIANYGMEAFSIHENDAKIILGKYLSSRDRELREAAIFTICKSEIEDLVPAVRNILKASGTTDETRKLCEWTLFKLEEKGIPCH